jgi:molecular chaperone GrpE
MKEAERSNTVAGGNEPSEIEQLREELRREHEMYLRALADFDNFRRRAEGERARAAQSGKRDLILSLLELLDGFERALQHIGQAPSSVSEGVGAIHRKLLGLLEAQGVTPLTSVGEVFDPALHEAIGSVESDEYAAGAVADEVQRGYVWGDELLRPARVRVAQ